MVHASDLDADWWIVMKRLPTLNNQSGQAIVESVLIIVIFLTVSFAVTKFFKDNEVLKGLVTTPFGSLAGMLQNGAWGPPARTNLIHPAAHARHVSLQGESAK